MYKALYLESTFEEFTAAWGAVARPTPYLEGFTMPLGWEEELSKRGIEFTEIEIPIEQSSNDGVAWEGL